MIAKILIGSPIRQNKKILKEFLQGLKKLDTAGLEVSFCFVDDCENNELIDALEQIPLKNVGIISPTGDPEEEYICDEYTHHWAEKDSLVWRVANHKHRIMEERYYQHFDYLFLVDSDIILDPRTLRHLVQQQANNPEVQIVSSVFWTKWEPHLPELPQVWEAGQYDLSPEFVQKLKTPGLYEVGGLGACTLISRKVLEAGVDFSQIPDLNLWGEDRHFCHTARQKGFKLYADTHLQQKHLSNVHLILTVINTIEDLIPFNYCLFQSLIGSNIPRRFTERHSKFPIGGYLNELVATWPNSRPQPFLWSWISVFTCLFYCYKLIWKIEICKFLIVSSSIGIIGSCRCNLGIVCPSRNLFTIESKAHFPRLMSFVIANPLKFRIHSYSPFNRVSAIFSLAANAQIISASIKGVPVYMINTHPIRRIHNKSMKIDVAPFQRCGRVTLSSYKPPMLRYLLIIHIIYQKIINNFMMSIMYGDVLTHSLLLQQNLDGVVATSQGQKLSGATLATRLSIA